MSRHVQAHHLAGIVALLLALAFSPLLTHAQSPPAQANAALPTLVRATPRAQRLAKDGLSDDLVFRAARAIVGGREHRVGGGKLERGATESSIKRDSGARFQTSGTPPPPGSIIMPPPQSSGCAGCTGQSGAGLTGTLALSLLALLGSLPLPSRHFDDEQGACDSPPRYPGRATMTMCIWNASGWSSMGRSRNWTSISQRTMATPVIWW